MPKKIWVWYWMIYHWIMQITCPKKIGYGPWTSPHVNGLDSAVQYGKEIPQYQVGVQPTPLHHWKHNTCIWVIWIHKYLGIISLVFSSFYHPRGLGGLVQTRVIPKSTAEPSCSHLYIYICIILPIKKTQPVHQLFDMILSCGWWMLVLPCPMKYERTYPPLIKWGTCSTSPTENHTKPWGCYMGTGQNLCTPGEPQYSWAGCSSENGVYRYWCMATSLCMIKYIPLTIMKTNQHPNLNHH